MRTVRTIIAGVVSLSLAFSMTASAQNFQHTSADANDGWIAKWLSMGNVINNGGFAASAVVDYVDQGTGGKSTYEEISTVSGLKAVEKMVVALPQNGGDLKWKVVTINTADGDNMATSWGMLAASDNFTWHGIIVMKSPTKRTTTMHPAHDDHAQIWINGEKVYDNSQWTGGVRIVTTPTDVSLLKGDNVLLYKCGESGGSAYVNLHFEDADDDIDIAPTLDDKFWPYAGLAVEPAGKSTTSWGSLKMSAGL